MSRFDTVVIDADQMCYSVGFAAKDEPISHALSTIKRMLDNIQKECGATERKLYVKGKGNFREAIAITKGYKDNRKDTAKPAHLPAIYQYLIDVQGATTCDGMEADDYVSVMLYQDYLACGGDRDKAKVVVSSCDKDLNNTPGWHHHPRTGEVVWYSDIQATRHFWYQMLVGDKADNIGGLPLLPEWICSKYDVSKKGVGEAAGRKLMATTTTHLDAETLVYELYMYWGQMQGYSDSVVRDYILEQGQLLWMTREVFGDGTPLMFQINEDLYGQARDSFRRNTFPPFSFDGEEAGETGEGQGDDPYRASEWESEYSDKLGTELRIIPSGSRTGRTE